MDHLRQRQEKLNRRAAEFADLQLELERVQSSTAEAELESVRGSGRNHVSRDDCRLPMGYRVQHLQAMAEWKPGC